MTFDEQEQGLLQEIRQLNNENRRLKAQVDELSKRPEVFALEITGDETIQFHRWKTRLTPGQKYKLIVHENKDKVWAFSTPLMLVETPGVIVLTKDLHTPMEDDIIITGMRKK